MKKVLLISLFVLLFCINTFSQNDVQYVCPSVSILGPNSTVYPGETMTFTASIVGFDTEKHKFNWKVSADKESANDRIIGDEKLLTIEIDTTGLEDTTVVAVLEIEGLPETCQKTFSETGIVAGVLPIEDWDEFGDIRKNDVRTRVDLIFVELMNNSDAMGYIVNYGPKKEVRKRENLIRKQAKYRKFDINRIVFVNGGEEKTIRTRFMVIPKDVDPSSIDL